MRIIGLHKMLHTLNAMCKQGKIIFSMMPSVTKIIPFVFYKNACILPNIGIYKPFVSKNKKNGFTLVELVVTLTVIAVVTVFGVPALRSIIQTQRITTATNDVISDIHVARSEALRRATPVGLCSSTSGNACDGGGGWQLGRIIFVDENNNQTFDVNEEIVRSRSALVHNTLTVPGLPGPLLFNSRGSASNLPLGGASFNVCDDRGVSKGRAVNVTQTGHASTGVPAGC